MTVVILVGSETGNALDYGNRLVDDLERLGIPSEMFLMDEFPLERLLEEDLTTLLFICSTTGDGEEPKNMKKIMKFLLRADLPCEIFNGIDFGVFGLGDSSYDKFNFVGKRVYRRMQQLGGRDFVGFRGEGDERNVKGIEGGWTSWWDALKEKIKTKSTGKIYSESEPLPPRHKLILDRRENVKCDIVPFKHNSLEIVSVSRVTPSDHFQDTRLLKFKTTEPLTNFKPGDIMNLKPSNDPKQVQELFDLLGWNEEMVIYGIEGDLIVNGSIEFPIDLKSFITDWIDLSRIPSRNSFKTLASLCSHSSDELSQLHYEKLLELSVEEGEYLEYVWRPKRTILEILKDFQPTLRIEIERIFQVFPVIKPRQFSIANYDQNSGVIELLIALVQEEMPLGRGIREGLCSKWIKSIEPTNHIDHVSISHGSLNYSILTSAKISKIFLFATGTGIAPIRSIIKTLDISKTEIYLYFGFRSEKTDFYFENEWKELELKHPNNFKLFAKGSRDNDKGRKIYINDLIKANPEPLIYLASPDEICCIVAGNSRLNKLIQDTLIEIWNDSTDVNRGKKWMNQLKQTQQYQCETWS